MKNKATQYHMWGDYVIASNNTEAEVTVFGEGKVLKRFTGETAYMLADTWAYDRYVEDTRNEGR
jgi:hypothetical protein